MGVKPLVTGERSELEGQPFHTTASRIPRGIHHYQSKRYDSLCYETSRESEELSHPPIFSCEFIGRTETLRNQGGKLNIFEYLRFLGSEADFVYE